MYVHIQWLSYWFMLTEWKWPSQTFYIIYVNPFNFLLMNKIHTRHLTLVVVVVISIRLLFFHSLYPKLHTNLLLNTEPYTLLSSSFNGNVVSAVSVNKFSFSFFHLEALICLRYKCYSSLWCVHCTGSWFDCYYYCFCVC